MNHFRCRWRVRRLRSVGKYDLPYVVEYRPWYCPWWCHSTEFKFKETAVKYAEDCIEDEEIKIS